MATRSKLPKRMSKLPIVMSILLKTCQNWYLNCWKLFNTGLRLCKKTWQGIMWNWQKRYHNSEIPWKYSLRGNTFAGGGFTCWIFPVSSNFLNNCSLCCGSVKNSTLYNSIDKTMAWISRYRVLKDSAPCSSS